MRPNRLKLIICLLLVVATVLVFLQVKNHGFVNYDDHKYVTDNHHVRAGLTWEGVKWAFTTTHASNWHPLTWLSHMLDCELYGLNAGWHHVTNLLFHIVNTLLLFLILNRMTGALWRSAFVAALFALHPLHVESVSWVAERKDVLSTFFWMLTVWAYIRYVERTGIKTYLLVLLFFALGLMAKPMLVTLPFVLLLLDYWPLGRLRLGQSHQDSALRVQETPVIHLIWEKVPLFVLTAISSVVTFYAQQAGGGMQSLEVLPFQIRFASTIVAYIGYIGKMLWPTHLAVFYPHAGMPPTWQTLGAGLLLTCISVLVIWTASRSPYLAVGWLWYLGTLMPVIGLVQVGGQAMADRYTYVPLIGLFIIIAWGVAEFAARWRFKREILVTCTAAVFLALAIGTWSQGRYWQNSITLFEQALDVTTSNHVAHSNLGLALADQGRHEEAVSHFVEAVRIKPEFVEAHNNLGVVLAGQGKHEEAVSHFVEAVRISPYNVEVRYNLGLALAGLGRFKKAITQLSEAVAISPHDSEAHKNLSQAYWLVGDKGSALREYEIVKGLDVELAKQLLVWMRVSTPDHP